MNRIINYFLLIMFILIFTFCTNNKLEMISQNLEFKKSNIKELKRQVNWSYKDNKAANILLHFYKFQIDNYERDFKCSDCKKSFISNMQLQEHYKCHLSEKPYVCNFCHKRFKRSSGRLKHENAIHKNIKYQCNLCKHIVNRQESIILHLKKSCKKAKRKISKINPIYRNYYYKITKK